jgi:hypothetical protein
MKYADKARLFREMCFRENRVEPMKWSNPEEFQDYICRFGGRFRSDMRRRRGYLVCYVQGPLENHPKAKEIIVEVPMEFAEKALAMGGLP